MSGLNFDLSGRVAVVSGGGTGIGRATALLLARSGVDVVVAGRSEDSLTETVDRVLSTTDSKALAIPTDVRDNDAVYGLIEQTMQHFHRLDILVNNAGGTHLRLLDKLALEDWDSTVALNLSSVFVAIKAATPHLEAVGGTIVNVSSISASTGIRGGSAYSSAKSGVEMLTRVAAAELGPRGIRVNCVAPGMIASERAVRAWDRGGIDVSASEQRIPLRRVGEPEEIALAVVFLASPAASYITGEVLHVDGGPWMDGPEVG